MSSHRRFNARIRHTALAFALTLVGGFSLPAQAAAPNGSVELSPTPPNETQAVPPNIVVTFDDSGSMASPFLGDNRPFDDNSWNGRWECAGLIDASATSGIGTHVMNGVYYNPNITYIPPLLADGTSMLNADATVSAVWNNGIRTNRPLNPSNSDGKTDFTQTISTNSSGSRWNNAPQGCPYDTSRNPTGSNDRLVGINGPYYYRYTGPALVTNSAGNPNAASISNLYTNANWTLVAVPAAQYQNWANWWAYYHQRTLMAQSGLSRVFGGTSLGATTSNGGFGSAIRVAWQNLNDSTYKLPATAIISSLIDTAGCTTSQSKSADPQSTQRQGAVTAPPPCYRSAFFNWIFQVAASGSTPTRSAVQRAGDFFSRGTGNTGGTGNLEDPYWQPAAIAGADGNELVCRQNYHMLVTDGLWNIDNGLPARTAITLPSASLTLPDGQPFPSPAGASVTSIYAAKADSSGAVSMSDLAFHYWATNLRGDLYNGGADGRFVAPYLPDTTLGVTPTATLSTSTTSLTNKLNNEVYFNPVNDPATWPHMSEYLVGLGVNGVLDYSSDTDCSGPSPDTSDACNLRKGIANSSGVVGWPTPNGAGGGIAANIDDTWHAALDGRGQFFSAGNPQILVDQLSSILTSINTRSAPATTSALNTSVLVQGALGYTTGYSSVDWSGTFQASTANADGTVSNAAQWDANSILTAPAKTDPIATTPPTARNILTSTEDTTGTFSAGIAFRTFSTFDASAQTLLSTFPAIGGADTGQGRVDWLRGVRTLEGSTYRSRSTLLGAIINSQTVYVSYPSSGYRDTWPSGSPEATAIAGDSANCGTTTPTTCHTYESFTKDNLARKPVVYVGANDGMLHAFDASENSDGSNTATSGHEVFAYVPRAVYANLGNLTAKSNFKFAPTVDATPVTRDVFFGGAWHTILVGGLRMGGRGVYALDITDPTQVTEANAGTKVLWEFSADTLATVAGNPANLGYTYGQPNIGRLANGKWAVLVPGGYFPDCSKTDRPANCATIAAASNGYSSLFVLDAQTGVLIRELKTLTTIAGVTSGGLSSAVLGDYNNDQVDDVAFAGDLNGNLWRFDLTDPNPVNWQAHVSLAFNPTTQGAQPITVMPRLFPDPATNRFIVVFGTGKYLGAADNTSNSAVTQSIYGIRDELDGSGNPITIVRANLQQQTLFEGLSADGIHTVRGLTDNTLTAAQGGWYIDLNLATSPGERVVVTPGALFDSNRVIITTLIPGTQDPCNATIGGALMVFNAATGGSGGGLSGPPGVTSWGSTISVVGGVVNNPPTGGSVPVATVIGGGTLLVPGLQLKGGGSLNIDDAIWRRRSWRELNNDQ